MVTPINVQVHRRIECQQHGQIDYRVMKSVVDRTEIRPSSVLPGDGNFRRESTGPLPVGVVAQQVLNP